MRLGLSGGLTLIGCSIESDFALGVILGSPLQAKWAHRRLIAHVQVA